MQEKNITHPTDVKLFSRVVKNCRYLQRFLKSKVRFKEGIRAERKLRVIAGRLTRGLFKKNSPHSIQTFCLFFDTFIEIVHQKKSDKDKVCSVHEPDVQCISKGKEHKKYEFGHKVSLAVTKNSRVCGP